MFSSALSSLPGSPSGLRTSRSTGGDALETERWSVDLEHPAGAGDDEEGDTNGSWDPLATVMADDEEVSTSEREDAPHERLSDRIWGDEVDEAPSSGEPSTFSGDLEELQFTRLSEAAILPTRAHDGDAGLDLYASRALTSAPASASASAPGSRSPSRRASSGSSRRARAWRSSTGSRWSTRPA